MKHNAFILRCFLQFAWANLDGSQKERGNFLNLHQKEGGTQKGGEEVSSERGGPTMEETMVLHAHRSLKKELSLVKFNMKIHFPPPFSQ